MVLIDESHKKIMLKKKNHVERIIPFNIIDVPNKTKLCMKNIQNNKVILNGHVVFDIPEEKVQSELRFSKQNTRNMKKRPQSCVNPSKMDKYVGFDFN